MTKTNKNSKSEVRNSKQYLMTNKKFQIPNNKSQIPNKLQITNSNVQNSFGFGIWVIRYCLEFVILELEFLLVIGHWDFISN